MAQGELRQLGADERAAEKVMALEASGAGEGEERYSGGVENHRGPLDAKGLVGQPEEKKGAARTEDDEEQQHERNATRQIGHREAARIQWRDGTARGEACRGGTHGEDAGQGNCEGALIAAGVRAIRDEDIDDECVVVGVDAEDMGDRSLYVIEGESGDVTLPGS